MVPEKGTSFSFKQYMYHKTRNFIEHNFVIVHRHDHFYRRFRLSGDGSTVSQFC
jgi:hypothetical protein